MRRAEVDSNLARVPLHSVVLCAALVQRCRRQRTVLAACARVLTAGVHITLLQQHTLLHRSRIPLRQPSQRLLLLRRDVRGKPRPPPLNLSLKAESPRAPRLRRPTPKPGVCGLNSNVSQPPEPSHGCAAAQRCTPLPLLSCQPTRLRCPPPTRPAQHLCHRRVGGHLQRQRVGDKLVPAHHLHRTAHGVVCVCVFAQTLLNVRHAWVVL